jgi:hypothetical protein
MGRDDFLSDLTILIVTHPPRWDLEGMTWGLSGKLGTLKSTSWMWVQMEDQCGTTDVNV